MVKKNIFKISVLVMFFVLLTACSFLNLFEKPFDAKQNINAKFGTLKISTASSSGERAIDIAEIKSARIIVSGTGIASGNEPSVNNVVVNNGLGSGFTVTNIPVGKNRIVTVQAYDSNNAKIDGIRLRAIVDINAGNNSVVVNWATTALGSVFASLHEKNVNISSISIADKNAIIAAIDSSKHASLIDTEAIANDYKTGVGNLKQKSAYVLSPASLKLSYTQAQSYKIVVSDPSSAVLNASSGENTLINIAPGTWKVTLIDSNNIIIKTLSLKNFLSGQTLNLGSLDEVPLTDIIVHAKPHSYIHYWATGQDGTSKKMNDEANGWFGWKFENTSSINLLFSTSNIVNGDWSGKTGDLVLTECGEYWYANNKWHNSDPDKPESPVITVNVQPGTYLQSQNIVLSSQNANGDTIYYTLDGTTPNVNTTKYTSPIAISSNKTIKAIGYNANAEPAWGSIYEFSYIIDPNADIEAPKITPSKAPGAYNEGISFNFTITDNKNKGATIYYTNDGSTPTISSSVYATIANGSTTATGQSFNLTMGNNITIKLLAIDASGNQVLESYTYRVRDPNAEVDFREETIYFLMTTRFYDGDPSNNRYCWDDEWAFNSETLGDPGWRGDFKGLIEKLDYIKALGFTAIWITPVVENASGLDYHGYHAFDFSRVDPRYESPGASYQDLINACHAKGIKVIQDIVLNHTGNFGERNLLPIMKKDYSADDGSHSPPAIPDHTAKDIYGNSAYAKLSAGAALQGFSTYEEISNSNLPDDQKGGKEYQARLMTMKNDDKDSDTDGRLYHHYGVFNWEDYYVQEGQMAGDCVDLNTENPVVAKYLRDCYIDYINMGVDGFRIDTMKHISRLTMNKEFIPQFRAAGGDGFFMFGEGCVLRNEVWNANMPGISVPFYTWNANNNKTDASYAWNTTALGAAANLLMAKAHFDANPNGAQLTSNNAFLDGNNYRPVDYSKASGLHMIDFYMHHKFGSAGSAYSVASEEDHYFNDATWNVTYVDSHDYGPNEGGYLYTRFSGGTQAWASNLNLMFTFRGIPCIYYGTEIEFQKDKQVEPYTNGNKVPYAESGRAYFGAHLEGTVIATDFGEYTATGEVAQTLSHPLAQHLIRLNKIRAAIPALQKGQYSTSNCNGSIAFKRRFTDDSVDSFAVVAVNGGASFTDLPGGTYIEVVTGDTKIIGEGGTITTDSIGDGNIRVYVNTSLRGNTITGKIGNDTDYLH